MNNKTADTFPIYIYNPIEDEWDFISSFEKEKHKKLIHDSNRFADCYLFANALLPSFTLVIPLTVSETFKTYFETLSETKCTILTPKEKTPFICDNIAADKKVFSAIISGAKKAGSLTIYTYAVTKKVFELKRKFEEAGVIVFFPEAPAEKDLWTVGHFGSKSGFRKSFASRMPPGVIELDPTQVEEKALSLFADGAGVVLKTDKGNAGQGIHIFRKSKIKSKEKLRDEIKKVYNEEPFLKKHPLVIESFIDTSKEKMCPFPSIEYFIHPDGRIEIPYYCNMIVTPEGEFYGMEMHEDVFSKKVKKQVLDCTMPIAEAYRDAGYRGRFDIDMMNDGKKVYADESNTRINGGTDTYLIVKKLVGNDLFSKRYVLSSYMDLPKHISPTFESVRKICAHLLFEKEKKVGIIINSESVIKNGGFSYIIVGKNKKETLLLHETLKKIITHK